MTSFKIPSDESARTLGQQGLAILLVMALVLVVVFCLQ